MTDELVVYFKPTCTTCRKTLNYLDSKKVKFSKVDYFERHLSKSLLRDLVRRLKTPPGELLRKNDRTYKELRLGQKKISEEEFIDLIMKNPNLLQRPIVVRGDKAVLALKPENIYQLLQLS